MIPTQLIRNHAGEFQGDELDQMLVSLYRAFREQRDGQPGGHMHFQQMTLEDRMKQFQVWLKLVFQQENERMDNLKIKRFFANELPGLRETWQGMLESEFSPAGQQYPDGQPDGQPDRQADRPAGGTR